jgi:hypothetical protein
MRDYEGPKWTDVPDGDVELRVLVPNDWQYWPNMRPYEQLSYVCMSAVFGQTAEALVRVM